MFLTKELRKVDELCGIDIKNLWSRPYEYAWVLDNINPETDTIVDAGCGLGHALKYELARICKHPVTAVDSDKHLLKAQQAPNLIHKVEKMSKMSLEDGSKNCIVCVSVLEHVFLTEQSASIKEWYRVLCDGGRVILTVDHPTVDLSWLVQEFKNQGFTPEPDVDLSIPASAIEHCGLRIWVCRFYKKEK